MLKKFLEVALMILGPGLIYRGLNLLRNAMAPIRQPTDEDRRLDASIADSLRGASLYEGEPEYMQTFRVAEMRTFSDDSAQLQKSLRPIWIVLGLVLLLGGIGLMLLWWHFALNPLLQGVLL